MREQLFRIANTVRRRYRRRLKGWPMVEPRYPYPGEYELTITCPKCGQVNRFPEFESVAIFICEGCGSSVETGALLPDKPSLEKESLVSELAAIDRQATHDARRQDIICPFCEEEDFDLIGLKSHLSKGHCADFERTETLPSHFQDGGRIGGGME